jgi:hypothetical protein
VRPQLEIKKIVLIALYKFAHGFGFKHMWNMFDVGVSTIQKYMDLIYVVIYDKYKLLNKAHKHTFFKNMY